MQSTPNPDWCDHKHHHFGADDGIVFIGSEEILPLADKRPLATHLRIELDAERVFISVIVIH